MSADTRHERNDMRVCANDGEPLVFTMEFPGAEWYCAVCRNQEDLFGRRSEATPERRRRLGELTEQYERERAERKGQGWTPAPRAGDPGVEAPTCAACGAEPEPGTPLYDGKPREWFSRTRDGVTQYVCRRSCIPDGEAILPW